MRHIKINLKNLLLIGVVLCIFNIGCDDQLEENPLDFPSPENFYSTEGQIISALTGSMGQLYSQWSAYSYGWGAFQDDHNQDTDLVLSVSHANWIWRAHYRAITILNSIVGALNEDKLGTSVPQATKDELMGQAKFLRGFNYFLLVRFYGDIPLITEDTDVVGGEISRQPISEIYSLIEQDLLFAVSTLPDSWPAELAGRPAKDAARGFLAKVYLTMATAPLNETANFQKARDMTMAVMDNGVFSLIPDVHDVFKIENNLGPENMFSFNATSDDIATPPQIWMPGSMAFGWSDFGLDLSWTDAYPDQPRKAAYMILEDWDGATWEEFGWRGSPLVRKFIYDERETLERLQSTANIPLLRYADILMMYAEAENMINGGPTQEAVDAVNQIINRANDGLANPDHPLTTTAMSMEEFDAAVINERSLELFYEYDRWHDLVRKRILCQMVRPEIQQNCNEDDYLWPIPAADLRLNELMTQNPGY